MSDYLSIDSVSKKLSKQGITFEFLPEVDSTNDYLKRKVLGGAVRAPYAVVAEKQVKGKGTKGRAWVDNSESCLKFSMVVEHTASTRDLMTLSPLLAVNLAEEFSKLNSKVKVKWPNDLMTSEGKLSGILIETVKYAGRVYLVFGIGFNLFPNCELEEQINRNIAFLFEDHSDKEAKREKVTRILADSVLKIMNQSIGLQDTFLLERWKKFDYFYQKTLSFRLPSQEVVEGTENGISSDGEIQLIIDDSLRKFNSGEILKNGRGGQDF